MKIESTRIVFHISFDLYVEKKIGLYTETGASNRRLIMRFFYLTMQEVFIYFWGFQRLLF